MRIIKNNTMAWAMKFKWGAGFTGDEIDLWQSEWKSYLQQIVMRFSENTSQGWRQQTKFQNNFKDLWSQIATTKISNNSCFIPEIVSGIWFRIGLVRLFFSFTVRFAEWVTSIFYLRRFSERLWPVDLLPFFHHVGEPVRASVEVED